MFKPFFSNPFKSLATRDGIAIGKGAERTMLDAVGDRSGFLKRFMTNGDGSTTMLQTRGGMPVFTTTDANGPVRFTISGSFVTPSEDSGVHSLHRDNESDHSPFRLWVVPKVPIVVSGITLDNGLTISESGVVTVPTDFPWYPVSVVVAFTGSLLGIPYGTVIYEIRVGNRRGRNSIFATLKLTEEG